MIRFTSFIFYSLGIFLLGMYAGYEKLGTNVRGLDWFLISFLTLYFLSHYKQSLLTKKEEKNDT